jgi:hypothetical protein
LSKIWIPNVSYFLTNQNQVKYQIAFALAAVEVWLWHISSQAKRTRGHFWRIFILFGIRPLLANNSLDFFAIFCVDFTSVLWKELDWTNLDGLNSVISW